MYIRTKDGVYEVLSEYEQSENTTLISNPVRAFDVKVTPRTFNGSSIRIIYGSEIIKQSENLEELCDEYVIPRYQDTFIVDRFSKQICLNHIKCGYGDVYGAIWTDKGLIYVAKMDERGDLELI